MKEEFDFESIKNKAIEQLKAGKPLLGKDGAFAPLLESILNAALEGEMDAHLTEEERQMGNRRNGKMQKQVQTPLGEVTVSISRAVEAFAFKVAHKRIMIDVAFLFQLTEILSIHNDKLTFFPTGRHNVVTFSSFFVFFVCLSDCFT